jgi:hypothetical protein
MQLVLLVNAGHQEKKYLLETVNDIMVLVIEMTSPKASTFQPSPHQPKIHRIMFPSPFTSLVDQGAQFWNRKQGADELEDLRRSCIWGRYHCAGLCTTLGFCWT